jgi:Lon protease-like protein
LLQRAPSMDESVHESTGERWEILPALTLVQGVLFPGARRCVRLETLAAFGAVREATRSWGERSLAVFTSCGRSGDPAGALDTYDVGTVAEVLSLERLSHCQRWVAEIRGTDRLRVHEHLRWHPFRIARIGRLIEPAEDPLELAGLLTALRDNVRRLAQLHPEETEGRHAHLLLANTTDPTQAVARAMELLGDVPIDEQQRALELPTIGDRLAFAIERTHACLSRRMPTRLRLLQ